ncbi:hypothetical protein BDR07DRAFT_1502156 [Suillus spraguei]|nr:hypothetical protein BDR07DRAFT_1502156 [Suillus spraguei]
MDRISFILYPIPHPTSPGLSAYHCFWGPTIRVSRSTNMRRYVVRKKKTRSIARRFNCTLQVYFKPRGIQGGLSSASSWLLEALLLSFSTDPDRRFTSIRLMLSKAHYISCFIGLKKHKKYSESYDAYTKRIEESYM